MTLSQSAVSELLEALRTGEAVDLIRESVRMVLQELIEAEATDVIGAARHERTDARSAERNGSRARPGVVRGGDGGLPGRRINPVWVPRSIQATCCSHQGWGSPGRDACTRRAPAPVKSVGGGAHVSAAWRSA
jgi:Transposase, Mutator family